MKILIIFVFSLFIVQVICNGLQQNSTKTKIIGPVQKSITKKLTEHFKPIYLDVFDESQFHSCEAGSERYFRLCIVSDLFIDKGLIERHKMVNTLLDEELNNSLQPLSMLVKTPSEWEEMTKDGKFPDCLNTLCEYD